MQRVSLIVYFILISGTKFYVLGIEDFIGACTRRCKTKAKRNKRAEDAKCASLSKLGNTSYIRVLPSVTAS